MNKYTLGTRENNPLFNRLKISCIDFMYDIYHNQEAFNLDGILKLLEVHLRFEDCGFISMYKNPGKNFELEISILKSSKKRTTIKTELKENKDLLTKLKYINDKPEIKYTYQPIKIGVTEISLFKLPLLFPSNYELDSYYIFLENNGDYIPFFLNDYNSAYFYNLILTIIESWSCKLTYNSTLLLRNCNSLFSNIMSKYYSKEIDMDEAKSRIKELYNNSWKIAIYSKETIDFFKNRDVINIINEDNKYLGEYSELLNFIKREYFENGYNQEELDEIRKLLPDGNMIVGQNEINAKEMKMKILGLYSLVKEKIIQN